MAYSITFKKSVSKDLKKLDKAEADRILAKLVSELPEKADSLPGLKGRFEGLKKYRIGDYRIIFTIIDDTILITRIRHRKSVYEG